ncbi:enoyl-CoA hydratase/isomerase family protein [Crenobacter caeni]|uniref:Enoyl-CoA hydratase/isomerase family protein n=1 Tax=Crenobacter caeni TaxID=2705474 RepID=A0A6B2KUJ6_9NEIS|nr:enoyl-CoA hydratase/isomerase family protein [Crenobacter caeni]NDV13774.1 enoyl-CoA hydratase/isomerase family protein [Crenobacter caeni]
MTEMSVDITRHGPVATVWLNRPERHNAMDEHLIAALQGAFDTLALEQTVRVIVLAGRGSSFCAGADLTWMQRAAAFSEEENLADARALAGMLKAIHRCPKPVVARVHGPAMAGGTGLIAACDIAIGTAKARFGLSEVRLGLIPATIGPYVVHAIGERHAHRYFLSAERIDAASAQRMGLLHEVVAEDALDARISEICAELAKGAPGALAAAKDLLGVLSGTSVQDDALLDDTARRIAQIRTGEEAREGLAAFFDKRPPDWIQH